MRRVIVTSPSWEPVTLAEAKTHLRLGDAAHPHDDMIGSLIVAARERVETMAGITLPLTTFDLFLDAFPEATRGYVPLGDGGRVDGPRLALGSRPIEVPHPPLVSVTWIKYLDIAETLQTIASNTYRATSGGRLPGRIVPASSAGWPAAAITLDAVQIRVVAGYASRTDVPSCAKQAMLLLVEKMYDNPSIDHEAIEYAVKALTRPLCHGRYS